MKTHMDGKKKMIVNNTNTINTDALISDFEFMHRMLRMNMALDIDVAIVHADKKQKK
jgi:hypothetical protein